MSAVEQATFVDALEQLGNEAWDVLAAAGCEPYHRTGDGFYIARPSVETAVHVRVHDIREGALKGCGDWWVANTHRLAPYERALKEAGFTVVQLDGDGGPLALIVARDAESAAQALQFALGAVQGGAE